ncbi:MAG: hypothetical protein U0R19_17700 [Bryobacteraceae bacterium]
MKTTNRTDAQKDSSRRNGAASSGPKSREGRARSSQNATKHGLYSPRTVLANESQEAFDRLHQAYLYEWNPQGQSELDLVQDLTVYRWKLMRVRNLEDAAHDSEMFLQQEDYDLCYEKHDPAIRHHDAENALHNTSPGLLEFYGRSMARLQRLITRVMNDLIRLQRIRLGHAPARNIDPQPIDPQSDTENRRNEPENLPDKGKTYSEPETFSWTCAVDKTKLNPLVSARNVRAPEEPDFDNWYENFRNSK